MSGNMFKTAGGGLKVYLTDWRNLLTHGLVGVALLVVAIWAPVEVWIKLIAIACIIAFNVLRMRRKKKRQALAAQSEGPEEPVEESGEAVAEGDGGDIKDNFIS